MLYDVLKQIHRIFYYIYTVYYTEWMSCRMKDKLHIPFQYIGKEIDHDRNWWRNDKHFWDEFREWSFSCITHTFWFTSPENAWEHNVLFVISSIWKCSSFYKFMLVIPCSLPKYTDDKSMHMKICERVARPFEKWYVLHHLKLYLTTLNAVQSVCWLKENYFE